MSHDEKVEPGSAEESRMSSLQPYDDIRTLTEAAERGDAQAQRYLADSYFSGFGVAPSASACRRWLRELARHGDRDAAAKLAVVTVYGLDVPRGDRASPSLAWRPVAGELEHPKPRGGGVGEFEPTRVPSEPGAAIRWLRWMTVEGPFDGRDEAQMWLAQILGDGSCPEPKERGKALAWLRKAADEHGSPRAAALLGLAETRGWARPRSLERARRWFVRAAERGHAGAAYCLAFFYLDGWGVEADNKAAAQWLRRSAELGDVDAQEFLGRMYAHGYLVERDAEASQHWLEKSRGQAPEPRAEDGYTLVGAPSPRRYGDDFMSPPFNDSDTPRANLLLYREAVLGVPDSQVELTHRLMNGWGFPRDASAAAYWFGAAGEEGHVGGLVNRAFLHLCGEGAPEDFCAAARLYREAAEKGSALAAHQLGGLYLTRKGVPRDTEAAVKWFRIAAEAEEGLSEMELARIHLEGDGVPRDLGEGIHWLLKAANEQDDAEALSLDELTRELIREHLSVQVIGTETPGHARAVERLVEREGVRGLGRPAFARPLPENVVELVPRTVPIRGI
jgi:TPR repeat protein